MECIGETMNEDRFFRVLVAHSLQKIEKTFLNLLFFYQLQSVIRTRLCKRRQNVNKKEAEEAEGKEVTEFIV